MPRFLICNQAIVIDKNANSVSLRCSHTSPRRWTRFYPSRALAKMKSSRVCPQRPQMCLFAAWMDPHLLLRLRSPPRPRLRLNFRSAHRLRGASRRACPTAGARGTGRAGASVAASAAPTSSQVRRTPAPRESPSRPPARPRSHSHPSLDAPMSTSTACSPVLYCSLSRSVTRAL